MTDNEEVVIRCRGMVLALKEEKDKLLQEPDERKYPIQPQILDWAIRMFENALGDRND